MRSLSIAVLACSALLLSACATDGGYWGGRHDDRRGAVLPGHDPGPGPDPLARSVTYTCEEGSKVVFLEGNPGARVTLSNGLQMTLMRTGIGGHYGARPHEFRVAGGEGLLYVNNRVFRCRVM